MCIASLLIQKIVFVACISHHQYDTIIYPNVQKLPVEEEKGFFNKVAGFAKNFFSWGGGSKVQETPSTTSAVGLLCAPTMEDTRKLCLKVYTREFCYIFKEGVVVSPMDIVYKVSDICNCLELPMIHNGRGQSAVTKLWKYKFVKDVSACFYVYLFTIIQCH